jgi:hypothetical protein
MQQRQQEEEQQQRQLQMLAAAVAAVLPRVVALLMVGVAGVTLPLLLPLLICLG